MLLRHCTIVVLFLKLVSVSFSIYIRILKSPIFGLSLSCINHHSLIISKTNHSNGVYLVDYSPINLKSEPVLQTRAKLLFGYSVPAEIRIRFIRNANFMEDKKILELSGIYDVISEESSKKISEQIYSKITDKDISDVIDTIKNNCRNNSTMALYRYNCQHFCKDSMSAIDS